MYALWFIVYFLVWFFCCCLFVFGKHISLPCLGFSAFLLFADSCVVNGRLLCWELPPAAPSRMLNSIASCDGRDQALTVQPCCKLPLSWMAWNILVAVWLYGSSCQLKSKATFFLKTKLQLFVSACCSESWAGYKTLCSFQSHYW